MKCEITRINLVTPPNTHIDLRVSGKKTPKFLKFF